MRGPIQFASFLTSRSLVGAVWQTSGQNQTSNLELFPSLQTQTNSGKWLKQWQVRQGWCGAQRKEMLVSCGWSATMGNFKLRALSLPKSERWHNNNRQTQFEHCFIFQLKGFFCLVCIFDQHVLPANSAMRRTARCDRLGFVTQPGIRSNGIHRFQTQHHWPHRHQSFLQNWLWNCKRLAVQHDGLLVSARRTAQLKRNRRSLFHDVVRSVVSKILRLQQKTTEIIFQLQKFFMQKLNWTQHKKGSDQTSLIEPFSQISFGTKSFLSLWFSCANAQKACSFQRVAFWSCMRPLRESEGRTLCTGCTNLSKNSHVLALVCFSHVSLFNEHISQMQICFDFKLALLCLLSCHVFDLLAHFGLHAHRIHSSIPHWLLKREHTIVLVALRVGIGLPRRLDNESSAAFCPPQSQWWWANISGFPCGAPGWSETPHGKPNSKLVHKTAQHRLVKSGPKMPGLHCTKSHRPFELFANENHKLWKEAKMNVMFLSLLRWTMLLREESTCQLHSLLWLCLQRQLALNDPEQNVSVRVTCVLTWRSERHGRCDTWTSVSDGGSLFS